MSTNGQTLGTCGYNKAPTAICELWTETHFQIFCWCFKDLTIKWRCAHRSASPRPQRCDNAKFPRFHWICFSLHTGAMCHRTRGKLWVHSAQAISWHTAAVAYPGILFGGREVVFNKFSWGQRERGYGGGSPLVRGSGGSCNLLQEISYHIVKFS